MAETDQISELVERLREFQGGAIEAEVIRTEAADTITDLRSRLLAAEKELEPFAAIAYNIPSSFGDQTTVSVGIDYTLSPEQVADFQATTGGALRSDRATLVLSMDGTVAGHFRTAREALSKIRGTP